MDVVNIKNRRSALIFTLLLHSLLLCLFLYIGLKKPDPPILEEGLPLTIRLGFDDAGQGETFENPPLEEVENVSPPPSTNSAPDYITQETKETVSVQKTENPKKVEKEKVQINKTETTSPIETPKEPEISDDLKQKLNKYKSKNPGNGSGGGNDGVNGAQGKEYGSKDGGDIGGALPGGGSYHLKGRKVSLMPTIVDDSQDEGKVVVDIIVNRKGNVIKATAGGKGTTASSNILFKKAQEAAYKTKFTPNQDAPEEQVGTMTFVFQLGN